jgi:hypothetical protein
MMDFHVSKQTSMLFCVFQNFTMPNKIDKQRLHLDKLAANSRNVQPKCIPSDQDILPEQLPPHLSAFPNASKEEIFCEYTNFLRTLPLMLEKEQTKVINAVKTYLDIETILKNICDLDFNKLLHINKGSCILEHLSVSHGSSFNILCPPITKCLLCEKNLTMHNKPTQGIIHSLQGPKYIYRCFGCHLSSAKDPMQSDVRQDVNNHHDLVSKKAGVTLKNQILCKKIF